MKNYLAQVNIGEQFFLKPNKGIGNVSEYQSLGSLISAILPNVYIIAGVITFILVLVAGLMFIINAGKGDQEASKNWQKTLTASLTGLLIIFLSYWIIQIIEVITGIKIFNR
ncbi:MAG: hypothetical protein ACPLKP_02745 [Microgenomates group bacterium]